VVLYELLTGDRLFKAEDTADTLAQVLTKEPDLKRVPAKIRRLLGECLQKDPRLRLRDVGDAKRLLVEGGNEVPGQTKARAIWIPWAVVSEIFALTGYSRVHSFPRNATG
jgi:hypothetical protein